INSDPFTFIWANGKPYTDKTEEFRERISRIIADLGGDTPENTLEAMVRAAEYPVREGAIKVQIVITDASYIMPGRRPTFGETNRPQPTLEEARTKLKAAKVRQVHFIIGSRSPPPEDYESLKRLYTPIWDRSEDPKTKTPVMSGMEFDLTRIATG